MKIFKNLAIALAFVLTVALPSAAAHAAGNASMSLSASGSGVTGGTARISIYENGDNVNVVTAKLAYDAGQLQYLSVDASQSGFGANASTRGGDGTVEVSRYATDDNGPTVRSGNQLVAVVNFKVLGNSGNAVVATAAGTQIVSNGSDIWNGASSAAAVAMSAPVVAQRVATPAPVVTPTEAPTPTPSPTPAPTQKATPTPKKEMVSKSSDNSSNVLPISLFVILIAAVTGAVYYYRTHGTGAKKA